MAKLRIGEYAKLRHYVDVYLREFLDIMIIEGSAGAGKSSIVREAFKGKKEGEYCWIEGRTTAAALYEKLFHHRDMPIVFDDVDSLYRERENINLLKCLCQTWDEKTVQWNTVTRMRSAIPPEFTTKSKVIIITNSWRSLNKHIGAVEDRGLLILFHPPADVVHRYVYDELRDKPEIFDEEVFNFIEAHLGIIKEPSVRHYRNAHKLKQAGVDWKEVLIESFGLTENEMAVLMLNKDKSTGQNEKARLFAQMYNKSERTYKRTKADLVKAGISFDERE